MDNDYKSGMLAHDNAIAGYMSQCGIDNNVIIKAFTADKSDENTKNGWALLTAAGYQEGAKSGLLPDAERFYDKYSVIVFIFSAALALIISLVFYRALRINDKQLQKAHKQICDFMAGDTSIRLEDNFEGRLSQLFTAINGMSTSLTALIKKEKQNREYLKDTISDISHQLKTPLAALQMYNEIMTDEKTDNEVIESFIPKSKRELDRMEYLIQNLLKLAKLDAGTIVLEKSVYSLKGFLEKCIGSFVSRAQHEGKELVLNCGEDIKLCMDEIWLGEAVANIIKNALDHTDRGNKIEIACRESVVSTVVIIRDNGTGIHPEDIHHIFKRFYRSRFSKNSEGVGIGLSLSRAIVENHGGIITVQSELGRGTEFQMTFPKLSNL